MGECLAQARLNQVIQRPRSSLVVEFYILSARKEESNRAVQRREPCKRTHCAGWQGEFQGFLVASSMLSYRAAAYTSSNLLTALYLLPQQQRFQSSSMQPVDQEEGSKKAFSLFCNETCRRRTRQKKQKEEGIEGMLLRGSRLRLWLFQPKRRKLPILCKCVHFCRRTLFTSNSTSGQFESALLSAHQSLASELCQRPGSGTLFLLISSLSSLKAHYNYYTARCQITSHQTGQVQK